MDSKTVYILGGAFTTVLIGIYTIFTLVGVPFQESDCQILNTSWAMLEACPKTIDTPQWVYVTFASKAWSGQANGGICLDGHNARLLQLQYYGNVTDANGTREDWNNYGDLTNVITNVSGNCYYANNFTIRNDTQYLFRFYMDFTQGTNGKYKIIFWNNQMTLDYAVSQNFTFLLDPWWNSTNGSDYGNNASYWNLINNGSSTVSINDDGTLTLRKPMPYISSDIGLAHLWRFENTSNVYQDLGYNIQTLSTVGTGTVNSTGYFGSSRNTTTGVNGARISNAYCNNHNFIKSPFTYEAWIKLTSISTTSSITNLYRGTPANNATSKGFQLFVKNAQLGFDYTAANNACGGTTIGLCTNLTLGLTQWYHIKLIGNSSGSFIYINGSLINSSASLYYNDSTIIESDNQVNTCGILGDSAFGNTGTINVDEIAIWNYSKTSTNFNTYDPNNNMFYSITNVTTLNSSSFNVNFNASDTNAYYRISNDNGSSWSPWLNTLNNSNIITLSSYNIFRNFQINISGTTTSSSIVYSLGIINVNSSSSSTYINLSINNFTRNINVELGSLLNLSANISSGTVCIDINHPSYGINYSCNISNTSFILNPAYFRTITLNDSSISNNLSVINSLYCLQETANISTYCGGLSTGNYSFDSNWQGGTSLLSYLYDGNYDTFLYKASVSTGSSFMYVNYSSSNIIIWQVRDGHDNSLGATSYNLSINNSYCNQNPFQGRVESFWNISSSLGAVRWSCYNSTSWIILRDSGLIINGGNVHEESIYTIFNNTFYIKSHQYDIPLNLNFNLSSNSTLNNVKVYLKDNFIQNIPLLSNSIIYNLTIFNDTLSNGNASYTQEALKTIEYIKIPKASSIQYAYLTLNGSSSFAANSLPAPPFVVIEANSVLSNASFTINNCNMTQFIDSSDNKTKWVLWDNSSLDNYETKRAKIYLTLFYGTNGNDYRLLNGVYITNLTALRTTEIRDINKHAFMITSPSGGIVGTTVLNFTIYLNNSGLTNSLWSYLAEKYNSGAGSPYTIIYFGNNLITTCNAGNPGIWYYCNYLGIDTSTWQVNNPNFLSIITKLDQTSGNGNFQIFNILFLTEGNISSFIYNINPPYNPSLLNYTADTNLSFSIWSNYNLYNPWLKVGILDGTYNWNISGLFSTVNITNNFNTSINSYLTNCIADSNGNCFVPFYLYSNQPGSVKYNNLNISYTYNSNPVIINSSLLQSYLNTQYNFTVFPLKFTSDTNGTLQISDIKYDYQGGNKTYTVTAHSPDYTSNVSYNITFYFTNWGYSFPSGTNYMEFIPDNQKAKNVSPYKQIDNSKPILNITTYNYGNLGNFSIYLNESYSCVNLSYSLNGNLSGKNLINSNSWINIMNNSNYLSNQGLWLYADYGCSNANWQLWQPDLSFRMCYSGSDVCDSTIS